MARPEDRKEWNFKKAARATEEVEVKVEEQNVGAKASDHSAIPAIIQGKEWKSLAAVTADDAL